MRLFQHIIAAAVAALIGLPLSPSQAGAAAEAAPPNSTDAISRGDLVAAARIARERAEAGDTDEEHALALFYWHGVAITQNFQEAIRWSTLAAVSGHKKAFAAREQMLITLDPSLVQKAMDWSRARLIKSAEGGNDVALVSIADSYSARFGFENKTEAYFWSALAVSSGQTQARRQRDGLIAGLKQADLIKTQQKAADWFERWRKPSSQVKTGVPGEH